MKDFPPGGNKFPWFLQELNPNVYLETDYRVVDLETSNEDFGSALNPDNRIILGAFGSPEDGFPISTAGYSTAKFQSLCEEACASKFIVAHHAKFELQWLYRLGVEPGSVLVFDTMLAEYVIRGNLRGPLDLDTVCRSYGIEGKESVVKHWIEEGVDPCLIPVRRLREYCERDVEITHSLFLKQRTILQDRGLLSVFFTRCLTTLVLSEIESRGMYIDAGKVEKEFKNELTKSRRILSELAELTGGINPKSPQQVSQYLYGNLGFAELTDFKGNPLRTPGGSPKTDEDTISRLRPTSDEQRRFIDLFTAYIPIKKRLETLTKLHGCAGDSESKGVLFAQYNQAVTATHRLSSTGRKYKVQFHNIDRDFKKLFRARQSGWWVGDADAPQLEWRVAAELGNDPQAKQDIRNHVDVHAHTAAVMYKKPVEKVTKQERTLKKPWTFKPVFGGKSGTTDERRYYKWFQQKYNALHSTQKGWAREVLLKKQFRAPSGLIFYWPNCRLDGDYIVHQTEIFNYPIQSFATADIIPITLVYLWYRLRGYRSFIVNTVHDSVVSEVHPSEKEVWAEITKQAFTTDVFTYLERVYGVHFTVPLGVAYNLAEHWGEGKDEEWEIDPCLN